MNVFSKFHIAKMGTVESDESLPQAELQTGRVVVVVDVEVVAVLVVVLLVVALVVVVVTVVTVLAAVLINR
jgi:hypothetical protein